MSRSSAKGNYLEVTLAENEWSEIIPYQVDTPPRPVPIAMHISRSSMRAISDSHIYPDLPARRYPRLLYRTLGDANEGANVSKIVGPREERAVEDEQ